VSDSEKRRPTVRKPVAASGESRPSASFAPAMNRRRSVPKELVIRHVGVERVDDPIAIHVGMDELAFFAIGIT
jgi:hypothetical protein